LGELKAKNKKSLYRKGLRILGMNKKADVNYLYVTGLGALFIVFVLVIIWMIKNAI
jgi:hypothetical protein